MRLKKGVITDSLHPCMIAIVLPVLEDVWRENGHELVVTSGRDGKHRLESGHFRGTALDFRTRYFADDVKKEIGEQLKRMLGIAFRVLVKPDHIHVRFLL